MAVKTGLIVTLALAVVFAAGCPKKQQDKSSSTPPSSASSEKNPPKLDTKIQPPPAANDQKKTESHVAAEQPKPTMPEPADLKPYESLNSAEAKINFITKYADEHPESEARMVYKVLDDNDVGVRKAAMDILIIGLKDSNPDFRNEVRTEINFLISQKFDTYDQAKKWWDDNRSKFDDTLAEKK